MKPNQEPDQSQPLAEPTLKPAEQVLNQPQPLTQASPTAKPISKDEAANAKYAEALLKMVNYEYLEKHPSETKHKRTVSNKQMFVVLILILATVLGTIIYREFNNSVSSATKSASQDSSKSKQLLHSAETFSNPSSY